MMHNKKTGDKSKKSFFSYLNTSIIVILTFFNEVKAAVFFLDNYLLSHSSWSTFIKCQTFFSLSFSVLDYYALHRSSTTTLSYEVNVIPTFNFPAIFLERIIRSDLPVNLQALACRSEKNFEGNQNFEGYFIESSLGTASIADVANPGIDLDGALSVEKLSPGVFKKSYASSSFDPLFQSSSELSSNWGVFGKVCKLDRPCIVDEVHLRRFDGLLVTDWL